jgi:serine/threonine-protein kinase
VRSVLRIALSKAAQDRYASATELAAELIKARDLSGLGLPATILAAGGEAPPRVPGAGGPTMTLPTPVPRARLPWRARAPVRRAALALAGALAVLAAGVALGRRLSPPAPTPAEEVGVTPAPTAAPTALAESPETASAPPSPAGRAPSRAPRPAAASERPSVAAAPSEVAITGTLQIRVKPWAEVWVDGTRAGEAWPRKQLILTAGDHVVRLVHLDYKPLERTVRVRPGKTEELDIDLGRDATPN